MYIIFNFRQRNLHQKRQPPNVQDQMKNQCKKGKSPSKPKSKARKQKISTEKARSQESDRMTALILASIGEDDDTFSGSARSSPKPKSKACERDLPPLMKRSITLPLDHHPGNHHLSQRHTSVRVLPFCPPAVKTMITLPVDRQGNLHSSQSKSSPILPFTGENDNYTPSQSSPLKSKTRKRESSPILPIHWYRGLHFITTGW